MDDLMIKTGLSFLLESRTMTEFQQNSGKFNELIEQNFKKFSNEAQDLVYDIQGIFGHIKFTGQLEKFDELIEIMDSHELFSDQQSKETFRAKVLVYMPWLLK